MESTNGAEQLSSNMSHGTVSDGRGVYNLEEKRERPKPGTSIYVVGEKTVRLTPVFMITQIKQDRGFYVNVKRFSVGMTTKSTLGTVHHA